MKTTVGDIELELRAKETPKTCRNFIQLCVEGYYHDPKFHIKGGDPTGTGEGGRIYGEPFKDDFRTRLRSCGRGLFVMANAGEDDNSSQFFFPLGSTLELQNKHTIFCKVTEETIHNMVELEEALVDENDRPLYPLRMLKSIILNNPFSVITSRIIVQKSEEVKDSSKTKTAVVRIKGVGRGNTYYAESRNKKGAAYVSTEKNAWQGHINLRINEEMENEYLVIVMKGKDKSDMESECC
ncbi:Peptidyl-prolyl cis-trans isomerase CWC27 like protein [Eufriesea mexicana]|uniref:Peptidyl-prolyl cis-trans isomerase n=1 Tax=Eufriesea mexicana TaxID=516756 RepID=A0A310SQ43_9HYME|nr:Peptidyl-prolyl cis-trans isomerase CWC27 like protein [Eufriesea mexicana]